MVIGVVFPIYFYCLNLIDHGSNILEGLYMYLVERKSFGPELNLFTLKK